MAMGVSVLTPEYPAGGGWYQEYRLVSGVGWSSVLYTYRQHCLL